MRANLAIGLVAGLLAGLLVSRPAAAQDIEVPILVLDETLETEDDVGDAEIDIGNVVESAAKTVTTVQEAPAIVTVLTGLELEDRGIRNMAQAMELVPGWLYYGANFNQYDMLLPRGTQQASLFMIDGLSQFDASVNTMSNMRMIPMETIKRIEVVTGPGGVLWGANSLMGIINVITKDADDVDGVEMEVGYGNGPGDRDVLRGYVMTGIPRLFGSERFKLFAHVAFETYKGPRWEMPYFLYHSPQPQPNSALIYGPMEVTDQKQSMAFQLDGKLTLGSWKIHFQAPFATLYHGLGFAGPILKEDLPEDELAECTPLPDGTPPADLASGADMCVDRNRTSRGNNHDFFSRFLMGEWQTRVGKGGVQVRPYIVQAVRSWDPIQVFAPSDVLLEGGSGFTTDMTNYRVGVSVDADYTLTDSIRLLYGGEMFHAWWGDIGEDALEADGLEAEFTGGPYNLNRLPFACPHDAEWDAAAGELVDGSAELQPLCPTIYAFDANQTVFGTFVDAQWRPRPGLIVDGGVRLQIAPDALSSAAAYDLTPSFQGAVVYEVVEDWHVKLNYTEGFRPPIFNYLTANKETVQLGGNPDLLPERSQALQGEVNARLLRGVKRVRELDIRVDYSYTWLRNLILFPRGVYENLGDRGIQSVEALAKLYLRGDHRLELGYTWLKIATEDVGWMKSLPEHWFHLSAVNTLVPETLEASFILRVYGGHEDPNRRVEVDHLTPLSPMNPYPSLSAIGTEVTFVAAPELVLDRIPPSAELQVGVDWQTLGDSLTLSAYAYNAFNSRRYQIDAPHSYSPRLELVPNPAQTFRFLVSAEYRY